MKRIQLTKNQFTIIDDEDFESISKFKWYLRGGYAGRREGKKTILMHREILNPEIGYSTDHINGDKLDNRRENLRQCTKSQNGMNQKIRVTSSRFKGVCKRKINGTWIAYISKDGRRKYLGSFGFEIDAARAYNKEAIKTFGEFALLNPV